MLNNKTYYPTPKPLIDKMLAKIQGKNIHKILEPSAGKGDIINALQNRHQYRNSDISAIEIDLDLQATLRGKYIKVIDGDFLTYAGPDKFDLIIANPPFDEGDKHLLKAIDILYRGEIVFLLNAETIKNPYTNTRKELIKQLTKLNAEIEYIQEAFKDAERPTGVEIALVYIRVEKNIEDDLFEDCKDKAKKPVIEIEESYEVSTQNPIPELVAVYNETVKIGIETILGYYRNYKKIGCYIGLNDKPDYDFDRTVDMTEKAQKQVNELLVVVRTKFWRRTLTLPEVKKRLTQQKQEEFETKLVEHCNMDFTESNIRQFVLNLIKGFNTTLMDVVVEVFDKFTIKHHWNEDNLYNENIHYFNGWKTNKAFKVGKKVIIPCYGLTDRWNNSFKLDTYDTSRNLQDIDVVMDYFRDTSNCWQGLSIVHAIEAAFKRGQSSKIISEHFAITCYKKGTIHLTFNDEETLRRFNLAACLGKNWLPYDYGHKPYPDMDTEEKDVVDSFEGE
ncbi:DUF4942 domain-containing protein, partial [Patescibacteria group bacterium]|nr:DUF4942 domain-containing protein [Patescibacteria group bacterium]